MSAGGDYGCGSIDAALRTIAAAPGVPLVVAGAANPPAEATGEAAPAAAGGGGGRTADRPGPCERADAVMDHWFGKRWNEDGDHCGLWVQIMGAIQEAHNDAVGQCAAYVAEWPGGGKRKRGRDRLARELRERFGK